MGWHPNSRYLKVNCSQFNCFSLSPSNCLDTQIYWKPPVISQFPYWKNSILKNALPDPAPAHLSSWSSNHLPSLLTQLQLPCPSSSSLNMPSSFPSVPLPYLLLIPSEFSLCLSPSLSPSHPPGPSLHVTFSGRPYLPPNLNLVLPVISFIAPGTTEIWNDIFIDVFKNWISTSSTKPGVSKFFSENSQKINILVFTGHWVSVVPILCHCHTKAAIDNM